MARRANFEEIEGIPEWAIPWFEYGSAEVELSEEDMKLIRQWRKENPGLRYAYCIEGSASFDHWPAFGLPCVTYTCIFEKVPKKRKAQSK